MKQLRFKELLKKNNFLPIRGRRLEGVDMDKLCNGAIVVFHQPSLQSGVADLHLLITEPYVVCNKLHLNYCLEYIVPSNTFF